MDTNFNSRYEGKLDDFEKRIKKAKCHQEKQRLTDEMNDYMLKCLPYMERIENEEHETITHPVFGTKMTKGVQRQEIYYDYLENVENQLVNKTRSKDDNSRSDKNCRECGSDKMVIDYQQSNYICTECGLANFYQLEELSYREEQETSEKIISYSYKRDNHFNEWILQLQAQEQTNIPDEVIDKLRMEFKKQKIKKLSEITPTKVRTLLKKLDLNKYYEHVPYITNILNGVDPPKMSQELEERLRQMFKDIQEPFNKHCPESRKNFLSYSYVLYKFCELLEEDDFLPCFPLLKAKDKLYQQDVIWKNICKELQWEFIPTI